MKNVLLEKEVKSRSVDIYVNKYHNKNIKSKKGDVAVSNSVGCMNDRDWSKFLGGKIALKCSEERFAVELLKILENMGYVWNDSASLSETYYSEKISYMVDIDKVRCLMDGQKNIESMLYK